MAASTAMAGHLFFLFGSLLRSITSARPLPPRLVNPTGDVGGPFLASNPGSILASAEGQDQDRVDGALKNVRHIGLATDVIHRKLFYDLGSVFCPNHPERSSSNRRRHMSEFVDPTLCSRDLDVFKGGDGT